MKINPMWKQIITEQFLKTTIRKPSQFNLPPNSVRFALEQMCRLFPMQKSVQVRALRLAGLHAEELKPQNAATQLIFHIHGGAFFSGFVKYPSSIFESSCGTHPNASDSCRLSACT